MDAHAHLLSLGWAGPGHALDSRPTQSYKQRGKEGLDYKSKKVVNTGNGLVKPLMVSQRKDRFGLGKKDPAHEPAAGNQWWLKGFETALSNIGKSESERSGTATPVQAQVNGQKHQGLYDFFVKGQQMEGTINKETLKRRSKKRKSDQIGGDTPESNAENTLPEKSTADEFMQAAAYLAMRDKDEKRRTRVGKTGALEDFKQASAFFQLRKGLVNEQKTNSETRLTDSACGSGVEDPPREETKEERKERRRKQKEENATMRVLVVGESILPSLSSQDDTSKRKRKEERRRLKDLD